MTCAALGVEDVHNVLSVMQKNLECPICLDLMKEPVATRCDHIFCRFCMLQLLSKKKKGPAQCPMCKKEVTKRSLQESPRFKLLIDGLTKIINAFELDSGYKFFPSQDYAKSITENCKETQKKKELTMVQSTGYRNRKITLNRGPPDDFPDILGAGTTKQLANDAGTWSRSRPKRQRQESRKLIADFVFDSSEDDLFKGAGSLGSDGDEPGIHYEPGNTNEPNKKEADLKAKDVNVQTPQKQDVEDAVASDIAEYGFSERDLESTRSNLLNTDGVMTLAERSQKRRSTEVRDYLTSDGKLCGRTTEESLHSSLDEHVNLCAHSETHETSNTTMQLRKHVHVDRQTLKNAIDYQYDKDDSVPEDTNSTQDTPGNLLNALSRKRLKKSIQKVHEWLLKTSELLNSSSWDEELLSSLYPAEDQDASEKGSCMSDETEIMPMLDPSVVPNAREKTVVNIEDKIFGKVYKRDKREKSNQVTKVTCVADVHVDSFGEPQKIDDDSSVSNLKRKRRSGNGLQPEDFIKRAEGREVNKNTTDVGLLVKDDCLFGGGRAFETSQAMSVDIKLSDQGFESCFDCHETKPKKQKRSDKFNSTSTVQSLSSLGGAGKQGSVYSTELKIDTDSCSEEARNETILQTTSTKCKLLENFTNLIPLENNVEDMNPDIQNRDSDHNLPNKPTSQISGHLHCTTVNASEGREDQSLSENVSVIQNVWKTDAENSLASAHEKDIGSRECWTTPSEAVENTVAEEMDDSDLDTQHLLKTFKNASRLSFKLDNSKETANIENFDPVCISDVTNLPGGSHTDSTMVHKLGKGTDACSDIHSNRLNLDKSNINEESIQSERKGQSYHATQPNPTKRMRLRSRKKSDCSPRCIVETLVEKTDRQMLHEEATTADQTSHFKIVEEIEACKQNVHGKIAAVSKSKELELRSDSDEYVSCMNALIQSPAAVRQGDTRSGTGQGENEEANNTCYQERSCDGEQVNPITSANKGKGSVSDKALRILACRKASPYKSPEVYSVTPDGLLGYLDRPEECTILCAPAEKSFVFGDGTKLNLVSPVSTSQPVSRRKRRPQKLESSEEEPSGDEELPCFNAFIFGNNSNSALQKNMSTGSSPKQQGGGVMAMFSSCSTSEKTQNSLNLPQEAMLCSQESVNLFSSQSNTSDHCINETADHKQTANQYRPQDSSPKRAIVSCVNEQEQTANPERDYEDSSHEQDLDDASVCESEASHTGDSSGLSSQCEILDTQQRDAMRNNLEKLQREMAALEAVLEQHGTQSPVSGKEQPLTEEHVTIRQQEARLKQTDHGTDVSAQVTPEMGVDFVPDSAGLQCLEAPAPCAIRPRSQTPPQSPLQTRSDMPEKACVSFDVLKELKESVLMHEDSHTVNQPTESGPPSPESDKHVLSVDNANHAKATSKQSVRGPLQNHVKTMDCFTPRTGRSNLLAKAQQPTQANQQPTSSQRSSSPTFASPSRRPIPSAVKSAVVSTGRNFSIVASGLSQNELILVQRFARKTNSNFSTQVTESTTHVIMKTDAHLVCERTLKYFLGIAGRKWVVSYEWIVQSFREGRILDEYDFEVKGDVINGRNHRGPRRSRLGSDGLLLVDFEICCLGCFKDMTRENLEWMVSLCGAAVTNEPSMFKHKPTTTSLIIVQPDGLTDYAAMSQKYRAKVLTREWVLDSVASYKLQPFDNYLV